MGAHIRGEHVPAGQAIGAGDVPHTLLIAVVAVDGQEPAVGALRGVKRLAPQGQAVGGGNPGVLPAGLGQPLVPPLGDILPVAVDFRLVLGGDDGGRGDVLLAGVRADKGEIDEVVANKNQRRRQDDDDNSRRQGELFPELHFGFAHGLVRLLFCGIVLSYNGWLGNARGILCCVCNLLLQRRLLSV